MSTRERERGSLAFNKTGYPKFVKAVREGYNEYLCKLLKAAQDIHAILESQPQKKRIETIYRICNTQEDKLVYSNVVLNATEEHVQLVYRELFRGKNGNLTKPRASMFKKITNKQRHFVFDCNGADLVLTDSPGGLGLLYWDTFMGNGNVKHSVRGETYRIVIQAVNKHKWGKKEGGLFIRNDEHNMIDDDDEGEYLDQIISVYGELGGVRLDYQHEQERAKRQVVKR